MEFLKKKKVRLFFHVWKVGWGKKEEQRKGGERRQKNYEAYVWIGSCFRIERKIKNWYFLVHNSLGRGIKLRERGICYSGI